MSFSLKRCKSDDEYSERKFTNISYTTENLQFSLISSNYENNFILYKQKLNANEYQSKDIIINLLNNYLKIKEGRKIYSYSVKFINFDDIVSKLLEKYKGYDPYLLFINMDIDFGNLNIIAHAYNNENNMNFEITSTLDQNIYYFGPKLTFDEVYTQFVKDISTKVKTIIDEIINTNFDKIENYLAYLDLSYYMTQQHITANIGIYKQFKISLSELIKFNKIKIEFSDINNYYKKFEDMLIDSPASISLKYDNFKFKPSVSTTDNFIKLKLHVPLLNSYFNFGDMYLSTNKYSVNSYYSKKYDPILQKVIRLNYYFLQNSGNFDKFKDEYEKLVLK